MELGLVPGTVVELMSVAPLGDPIELLVRGASLSIRWREADAIEVELLATRPLPSAAPAVAEPHAA
jgi:ferrous iron transport protein A